MLTKTTRLTDWRYLKIGDLAEEVRSLFEPSREEEQPYIGLEHIEQGTLKLNGIGSSKDTVSTKKKFKKGEILFGSLRPYFRKVIWPKFNGVCSTDITVVKSKNHSCSIFLFYFISSQAFIDHATNISSGTRMPRASWKTLADSNWLFPPLPTQHKIASILSAYDDLIENNLRRIKILEEMAQNLYREWFVKFRFPGHENTRFVDSELGRIPEGWEVGKVESVLKKIKRRVKLKKQDYVSEGMIPVIDQGREFIGGYTDIAESLISNDLPLIVFGDHTRILKYIDFPFACGADGTQLLKSNDDRLPMTLFYYMLLAIDLSDYAYARHFKFLKDELLVLPTKEISKKFNQIVEFFFEQEKALMQKNITLRQTRDLLLPKLISGEVDVSELDIATQEEMAT